MRQDLRSTLPAEGIFARLRDLPGEDVRCMPGRWTRRVAIAGKQYFLKMHEGLALKEIAKNLLQLRLPVVGARHEREAACRLAAAGIDTLAVVAYGERGRWPWSAESFLLTEAIAPARAMKDVVAAWPERAPTAGARRAFVVRIARIVATMHALGINHRDLYLDHFLLSDDDRLHLIDLHRAQQRPRVPRRWLIKDLGSLWFSALAADLSMVEQQRFIVTYCKRLGSLRRDSRFWRAVHQRGRHLYAKGVRLGIVAPERILVAERDAAAGRPR